MLINFTKMHGLGNDFVVIDLITQSLKLSSTHIQRIADRHIGIGCDQVLLIEPPIHKSADFYLRIFNKDGKEVEQCGNGIRCATQFFYDMGFTNDRTIYSNCLAGPITASIEDDGNVRVNMGIPKFMPTDIPFTTHTEALLYPLMIEDKEILVSLVSMGNPHAILKVANIETAPVKKIGPLISMHSHFPKETNVSFLQILDRSHVRLRVYERGVGETLACGSAACAAVCAGIRLEVLDNVVRVDFLKGTLKVQWSEPHESVYMTGPATYVYIGRFRI